MQTEPIYAQGSRTARFAVPLWAKLAQVLALALIAAATALAALAADGWQWVADASLLRLSVTLVAAAIAACAVAWGVKRTGALRWLLGITGERKSKAPGTELVFLYRGPSFWRPLGLSLALGLPLVAAGGAIWFLAAAAPVPLSVTEQHVLAPASPSGKIPTHFWDYALLFPEDLLNQLEVQIPYEKGPPEKLLPRVTLIDRESRRPVLELSGKRPRKVPDHDVELIFHNEKGSTLAALWQFIPEIVRLEREAGMLGEAARPLWERPQLALIHFGTGDEGAMAIGTPWPEGAAGEIDQRFFYRTDEGAIFQVRARDSRMLPVLASVRVTHDAHGTLKERKEWALAQVQEGLSRAFKPGAADSARTRLMLAIASLLTMDPRDPEAFFHLGKLARDADTVHAALRYGRDVGLEPAKLAELQAELENR